MIPTYYKGSTKNFIIKIPVTETNPKCELENLDVIFTFFQYGRDGQQDVTINKHLADCIVKYIDGEEDILYSILFYDDVGEGHTREVVNIKYFKSLKERDATYQDLLNSGLSEYDISKSYMKLSDRIKPLRLEFTTTLSEEETLLFNSHNIVSYQVKFLNNTTNEVIVSDIHKFYFRESLSYEGLRPDTL